MEYSHSPHQAHLARLVLITSNILTTLSNMISPLAEASRRSVRKESHVWYTEYTFSFTLSLLEKIFNDKLEDGQLQIKPASKSSIMWPLLQASGP